jgi:hypothetical protein
MLSWPHFFQASNTCSLFYITVLQIVPEFYPLQSWSEIIIVECELHFDELPTFPVRLSFSTLRLIAFPFSSFPSQMPSQSCPSLLSPFLLCAVYS